MSLKKILALTFFGGTIAFAGLKVAQEISYRQSPEYARLSQLDKEAVEIYNAIKKEGSLSYKIDGKNISIELERWTGGRYHTHYGDRLELTLGEEVTFRSRMCRNFWSLNRASEYPEDRARKLEEVELKTEDGSRTYKIEEISDKQKFEALYENLIERVYQEKSRIDLQANSSLTNFIGGKSK